MSGTFTLGRVAASAQGSGDNFLSSVNSAAEGTAGVVISSTPGRVYRLIVQNGGATAYYVQIHNKATAAVNAEVALWSKRIAASSEVEIDLTNINGLVCTAGIGLAISTTARTLTLAAATDIAFRNVIYTKQA